MSQIWKRFPFLEQLILSQPYLEKIYNDDKCVISWLNNPSAAFHCFIVNELWGFFCTNMFSKIYTQISK